LAIFQKPIDLFGISRFVFFQNLAAIVERKRNPILKGLENELDQDDVKKMNGLMSAALVPQHCIVELESFDGVTVLNLLLRNSV
jgi:hypothetical protein